MDVNTAIQGSSSSMLEPRSSWWSYHQASGSREEDRNGFFPVTFK